MNLPSFPSIRKTNSVPGKPLFVSDAIIATAGVFSSILAIANVPSDGFGILMGLDYDSVNNWFTPGYVIMNDNVYFLPTTVNPGQYLIPNVTDVENKLHSDGNSYNTYTQYQVSVSNSPSTGSSPQLINDGVIDGEFSGAIGQYRLSLTDLLTSLGNEITNRIIAVSGESSARSAADGILTTGISNEALRIDKIAYEDRGQNTLNITDSGGIYNINGDISFVTIHISGSGGGIVNYSILYPCNYVLLKISGPGSNPSTVNIYFSHFTDKLLKTFTIGPSTNYYLFQKITENSTGVDSIWTEITSFTPII